MTTSDGRVGRNSGRLAACAVAVALGCGGGGGGGPTNPNNPKNQNPTVTVPASYVSGTWGGQVGRVGNLYPVTITFSGANSVKAGTTMGGVAYGPFANVPGTCAGTLAFVSLSGASLALLERISSGPCVDNGTVFLLYNADPPTSIRYDWSRVGAGTDTGTLVKR